MKPRLAFARFRHVHMLQFHDLARRHPGVEIAAAVEDDPAAAAAANAAGVALTHAGLDALFADAASWDVLAIGDAFARRGRIALKALALGKHVILDKPPCTTLADLRRIGAAAARRRLVVGCLLDMRDSGPMRGLRREVRAGTIGRVHSVTFLGQHPLLLGSRPAWYFERGMQGGTINDIAIHALDILPWLLGSPVAEIVAARVWNDRLPQYPDFEVGAQLMVRMANGTGCLGDVSYLAPDSQGYTVPTYWRFTLSGEKGTLETSATSPGLTLWRDGEKAGSELAAEPRRTAGVLDDFLAELDGRPDDAELSTAVVLTSARAALLAQVAARKRRSVRVG